MSDIEEGVSPSFVNAEKALEIDAKLKKESRHPNMDQLDVLAIIVREVVPDNKPITKEELATNLTERIREEEVNIGVFEDVAGAIDGDHNYDYVDTVDHLANKGLDMIQSFVDAVQEIRPDDAQDIGDKFTLVLRDRDVGVEIKAGAILAPYMRQEKDGFASGAVLQWRVSSQGLNESVLADVKQAMTLKSDPEA